MKKIICLALVLSLCLGLVLAEENSSINPPAEQPPAQETPVDQPKDTASEDVTPSQQGEGDNTQQGEGDNTQQGEGDNTQSGDGDNTQTGDGDNTQQGDGDNTQSGEGDDTQSGDVDNTQQGDGDNTQSGDGDNTQTGDGDNTQSGEGDSTQSGDGDETQPSEDGDTSSEDGDSSSEDGDEQTPPQSGNEEGVLLGSDGNVIQRGDLKDLLMQDGELWVQVRTNKRVKIESFHLKRLQKIKIEVDKDAFTVKSRVVLSLSEELKDELTSEQIAAFTETDVSDLYIWVIEDKPQSTDDEEPSEKSYQLTVEGPASSSAWSNVAPSFKLTGLGSDDAGCAYVAFILDADMVMLSGDTFVLEREGDVGVRFAIFNAMGNSVALSDAYSYKLDFTPPELAIEVSMQEDYLMTLSFSDALSGVASYSLDGGESWIVLDDSTTLEYRAKERTSFAPGMIALVDHAGNLAFNINEIVLDKLPSMNFGGFSGGGGAGTKKPPHAAASGDENSALAYNAYELELPEGEVEQLTLGGEAVELTLTAKGDETERKACFSAEFITWAGLDKAQDTLLLHAQGDNSGETFIWNINGAVLRKLYNSGVNYLLLEVDGAMLSLPTEGFVAGTKYAKMKMEGVSTAAFDYELRMQGASAASFDADYAACSAEIIVHVEDESYTLLDRERTPEMYYLNVYCAGSDLANYPYGEHPAFVKDEEAAV